MPDTGRSKRLLRLLFATIFPDMDPTSKEFYAVAFEMLGIIHYIVFADQLAVPSDENGRPLEPFLEARPLFINEADGLGYRSAELEEIETRFTAITRLGKEAALVLHGHVMGTLIRTFMQYLVVLTEGGRFGRGTSDAAPGDAVWLSSGCPLPIVLRRMEDEGRYAVMGSCMIPSLAEGGLAREIFEEDADRMAQAIQTIELA